MVVVGSEVFLDMGWTDALRSEGVLVFGPNQAAAQLETSKAFAKKFMRNRNIPTAKFHVISSSNQSFEISSFPQVVKASGLAGGKGVKICDNSVQVENYIEEVFEKGYKKVVIEDYLEGAEISVLALTDGHTVYALPPVRDFKRRNNGDTGEMTGGMGAYCPVKNISSSVLNFIKEEILQKTVDAMRKRGTPYQGVLYAGLMLTEDGPQVLEFNCRFGDPEAQVLLTLMESSLYPLLEACARGCLDSVCPPVFFKNQVSAAVVGVSKGYPNESSAPVHRCVLRQN